MKIWVDADACPVSIKEIIFRAAENRKILTTLLANHPMRVAKSSYIRFMQVASGFDVADNEIVQRLEAGDLVITSDIPLADEVITKLGLALSPRGELFTASNIKQRLNMRDFYDTLRASGVQTKGPDKLSAQDKQAFANQLDRLITRHHK